jgi:hypothetical protein
MRKRIIMVCLKERKELNSRNYSKITDFTPKT